MLASSGHTRALDSESIDPCVRVFTPYARRCVAFIVAVLPTNHLFGHCRVPRVPVLGTWVLGPPLFPPLFEYDPPDPIFDFPISIFAFPRIGTVTIFCRNRYLLVIYILSYHSCGGDKE